MHHDPWKASQRLQPASHCRTGEGQGNLISRGQQARERKERVLINTLYLAVSWAGGPSCMEICFGFQWYICPIRTRRQSRQETGETEEGEARKWVCSAGWEEAGGVDVTWAVASKHMREIECRCSGGRVDDDDMCGVYVVVVRRGGVKREVVRNLDAARPAS